MYDAWLMTFNFFTKTTFHIHITSLNLTSGIFRKGLFVRKISLLPMNFLIAETESQSSLRLDLSRETKGTFSTDSIPWILMSF